MGAHWSEIFDASSLRDWAASYPAPEVAWAECVRGDWMLGALARCGAHRPILVLSACDCARSVLHQVADLDGPRQAIEAAEAWATDRGTGAAARRAAALARQDAREAGRYTDAVAAAAAAAEAAALAATTWDARNPILEWELLRLAEAAARAADPDEDGYALHLRHLADVIRARRHPLRAPSPTELRRASDAVAVAWDRVSEGIDPSETLSAVQVLCAGSTALSLGLAPGSALDPDGIVLRGVAERLQARPELEPEVRALLGDVRGGTP